MIRGTTPTHIFTVSIDVSLIKDFVITYRQNGRNVIEKRKKDCVIDNNKIIIRLTQKDTFEFRDEYIVLIQMRVLTTSGTVLASNVKRLSVDDVLNEEVLV